MNPAILLLFLPLLFQGPKKPTKNWEEDRHPPSNMSKDPNGYNSKIFPSTFTIKLAFTFLGYDVGILKKTPEGVDEIINPAIVKMFQKDYNAISSYGIDGGSFEGIKIPKDMGHLFEDGNIGPHVLNALEHAMNWIKIYALAGYWQDIAYIARAKGYH